MAIKDILHYANTAHWCDKARRQDLEITDPIIIGNFDECELLEYLVEHLVDVVSAGGRDLVDAISADLEESTGLEGLIASAHRIQHRLLHIVFNLGASWAIDNRLSDYIEAGKAIRQLEKGGQNE